MDDEYFTLDVWIYNYIYNYIRINCHIKFIIFVQTYFGIAIGSYIEKRREEVFFSKVSSINDYEFFKGKYCCEWKFYSSKGTMEVLVPVALTEEEIHNMEKPLVDQKVRICFYRFSKILYSWEIL